MSDIVFFEILENLLDILGTGKVHSKGGSAKDESRSHIAGELTLNGDFVDCVLSRLAN